MLQKSLSKSWVTLNILNIWGVEIKADNNLKFTLKEKALDSKKHNLTQAALLIDIELIRRPEKVAFLSLSGFFGNVSLKLRLTRRQKNKLRDDT